MESLRDARTELIRLRGYLKEPGPMSEDELSGARRIVTDALVLVDAACSATEGTDVVPNRDDPASSGGTKGKGAE